MIVRHRNGEYPILTDDLPAHVVTDSTAFVITDENVAEHWSHLYQGKPALVLPPGESSKNLATYERCLAWLAENRASRSSGLIALGGGVIGDLGGFVAATYMRGIPFIQAPTTLLAMVDSSVGGKVGINLPAGKNLVGAFYPPVKVVLDFRTLQTLPPREFNNGAAEIYKYGAILDWALFEQLEAKPLGPGDERLPKVVNHCIDLKRSVVEDDEFETTGARAVLNFGHTVGHALENVVGYGQILHGEAVAIGMVVESAIGERIGLTPRGTSERIGNALGEQKLPVTYAADPSRVLEAMRLDKKAENSRIAMALLDDLGSCKLVSDVPETVVLECLRENL